MTADPRILTRTPLTPEQVKHIRDYVASKPHAIDGFVSALLDSHDALMERVQERDDASAKLAAAMKELRKIAIMRDGVYYSCRVCGGDTRWMEQELDCYGGPGEVRHEYCILATEEK